MQSRLCVEIQHGVKSFKCFVMKECEDVNSGFVAIDINWMLFQASELFSRNSKMSPTINTEETSPCRQRRWGRQEMQTIDQSVNDRETEIYDPETIEEKIRQENLWDAVNLGQSDLCKHILEQILNPNFLHDEYGCAPLHVAVENGDVDVVKVLLNNDCSVDVRDQYGQTALMHAAILDDVDMIRTLYKAGACIDAVDKSGKTALLLGLQDACKDSCKYLIRLGCDVNVVDRLGQSALYLLLNSMDMDVVNLVKKLIKAGYNVNQDKTWLQEEGMDVETVKSKGFFSKLMRKLTFKVAGLSSKSDDRHRTVYAESACGRNRIRILKVLE